MFQSAIIKTPVITPSTSVGDGSTEKPVGDGFAMLLSKKPAASPEKLTLVQNSSHNSSPIENGSMADFQVEESTMPPEKTWPEFSRETHKSPATSQRDPLVERLVDGGIVNAREVSEKLTTTLNDNDSNQKAQAPVQDGTATRANVDKENLDFLKERIPLANASFNFSMLVESKTSTVAQLTKTDEPVNEVKAGFVEPSTFRQEPPQQITLEPERRSTALPAAELPTLEVLDSKLAESIVSEVEVQDMGSVSQDFSAEVGNRGSSKEYHSEDDLVIHAETALRVTEVPIAVSTQEPGHAIAGTKQAALVTPPETMASVFQIKSGASGKSNPAISNAPPTITEAGGGRTETRLPVENAKHELVARDGKPMTTEGQPVAVLRNEPPIQNANAPVARVDVPDAGNIVALQNGLHTETSATKYPAVSLFQSLSQPAQTLASAIRENSNWSPSLSSSTAHTTQSMKADGTTLQTMRIQLNPVELGKVDLNLRMQQGQLQIEVRVENEQAHRALLADQEALFSTLRGLGYKVDNIVINGPGSDGSTQNQGYGQQDQQRFNGEKNEHLENGRGDQFKELEYDRYHEEAPDQDTRPADNII